MSTSLTNVYAYLRRTFEDVDMMLSKPVSYIKPLTDDDKIVFIFKEDRSRVRNPTANGDFHNSDSEQSSVLNVTGSPLRDDCSIDDLLSHSIASKVIFSTQWEKIEETYTPIDINKAREILVTVINQRFPPESRGWIYILCTDQSAPLNNSTFLLSTFVTQCDNVRGFANYHGIVKRDETLIKTLLKRHFSFISPNSKLNTYMESVFQISPNISLKFINTTSASNPSINHIDKTSEAILYQHVEIGKGHNLCENFWIQINLLNKIKQEIVSYRNSSVDQGFAEPNYKYGSPDMTYENLQEKVNQILSEINIISEAADATADTGLETVIKRAHGRQLSETSDQLWDLLKHTSSYTDLKKIVKFIFQVASRSNVVNLPTSNNRLSELIRELSQQRLAIPNVVGTEPLELLLEIGIEKVLRDFEFILSESKICQLSTMSFGPGKMQTTPDSRLSVRKSLAAAAVDLNRSARKTLLKGTKGSHESDGDDEDGMRNSRFVERDVESSLSKLAQVHLAIEHLLLIQNNLTIDNDYAAITKKLFAKPQMLFEDLLNQKLDKFEIAINDKKVIHLVENLVPNAQKIVMESGNKFKDIKNIYCLNIEQTVASLAEKDKEDEGVVDKSGDAFHFISYTTISSKF